MLASVPDAAPRQLVNGVPRVRRGDYLLFERGHLAYLNVIEKMNPACCSYAYGLPAHVRVVASRTEEQWCPIKHALRVLGLHARYGSFVDYDDADAYRHEPKRLRSQARSVEPL